MKRNSDSAIIILHEIYGINQHISNVCEKYYSNGYDVYCPNLINKSEPFSYAQQEEAYAFFQKYVGNKAHIQVNQLAKQIRMQYKEIILLGFSVGATIAWILSESGMYDSIVSYYGSRIRDNLHIQPKCQSLLIFAEQETSFEPKDLLKNLKSKPNVNVYILDGKHGFLDSFSENFYLPSADIAKKITKDFLNHLVLIKSL